MKRNSFNTGLKYYTISLLRYWYREWKITNAKELNLVYTMAKVGSSTIYQSLKGELNHPVFHIHHLNEAKDKIHFENLRKKGLFPDSRSHAKSLSKAFKSGVKVNMVSLVREPIARNVSAFFEAIEYYSNNEIDHLDLKKLKSIYLEKLPHELPLEWLDTEFKAQTGIDVYAEAFEKDRKYGIISNERINLLIMRTDLDDHSKVKYLNEFFNTSITKLKNYNLGNQKHYGAVYDTFLKEINFNQEYIDQMYDNKYIKHFFLAKEVEELRKKWSN